MACAVAVATAALASLGGCTTNELVGQGGACFQSIDCQDGLVCIYVNDAGSCTSDLTTIVNVPESGSPDAAPPDAPADQVAADVTPKDTGAQDTGTQDTGAQDTGTQDTGTTDSGGDAATD